MITLRHSEILQHDHLPGYAVVDKFAIYTDNLRSARATDTYTCAGTKSGETWQPKLTYHGFRYVEISQDDGAADGNVLDQLEVGD